MQPVLVLSLNPGTETKAFDSRGRLHIPTQFCKEPSCQRSDELLDQC